MNSIFVLLGIESWKPVLGLLILPPVPLLLLVLVGARTLVARRALGWSLILLAVALLWLSACSGTARLLTDHGLRPPPALAPDRIAALKAQGQREPGRMAIVVLGGGVQGWAPEYGSSNLTPISAERLRYGMWLARETTLPVAYSGGVGWGGDSAATEAEAAARLVSDVYGRPIRWLESRSRDTRQNALLTIAMLRSAGVQQVLLVTHGTHMPRALRAFREAAGADLRVEPAPMGMARAGDGALLRWVPSRGGFERTGLVLHELAGLLAGA